MASPFTMCASCFRAATRAAPRIAIQPAHAVCQSTRAYGRVNFVPRRQLLHLNSLASLAVRGVGSRPAGLARTLATASDLSSAKPAQAIQNPRTDDSGNPMLISISPRASNRLYKISTADKKPHLALRVTVESGGCHGFQYLMDLTDLSKTPPTDEDTIFEGEKGEKVVIDEASLELLNGSTVDYTMELIGSQFKITGIPGATSSCGCGTSFDIKL